LIDSFTELTQCLDNELIINTVIPYIVKYINENETEIKNKLLQKINIIYKSIKKEDFEKIFLPILD
jgi:lysine/ornithine N-monooxygenase